MREEKFGLEGVLSEESLLRKISSRARSDYIRRRATDAKALFSASVELPSRAFDVISRGERGDEGRVK